MININIGTADAVTFNIELFSVFISKVPEIPICQRSYVEERIDQFYSQLCENKVPHTHIHTHAHKIPYLGLLHCAVYKNNEITKYYIVDGQHRYYAYKKLYETTGIDFTISYVSKTCLDKNEIVTFFKSLNNNYELHDIILDDFDRAEILKKHIVDKYSKHISHSEKPKYPNINIDQVLKYILDKFKSSNIVDEFEKLNVDIQHSIPKNEKYNKQKQGLYIGYLFLKTENENEKKKIPASVRFKLWTNHYNTMTGSCTVCSSVIDNANFHAGHIISTYNGGTDNITNLSPVCSCCNLSMGTTNMTEFKDKYFQV